MSILTPPLSKRGILKALGQDPSKSDVLTVSTNSSGGVRIPVGDAYLPLPTRVTPVRYATFGDSTADSGYAHTNISLVDLPFPASGQNAVVTIDPQVTLLSALYTQAFPVANGGISGQNTTQMLARDTQVASASRKAIQDVIDLYPDVVFLRGGSINDLQTLTAGTIDAQVAATYANHVAIINRFLSGGVLVVDCGLFGYSASGATDPAVTRSAIVRLNAMYAAYAAATPGVTYLSVVGTLSDGSGNYLPGIARDGIHLSIRGQYALAQLEKKIMDEKFGYCSGPRYRGTNLAANPLLVNTSAQSYGTLATNIASGATNVTRKNAKVEMIDGKRYQTIEFIPTGASASGSILHQFDLTAMSINVGDTLGFEYDFYVSGLNGNPPPAPTAFFGRLELQKASAGRILIDRLTTLSSVIILPDGSYMGKCAFPPVKFQEASAALQAVGPQMNISIQNSDMAGYKLGFGGHRIVKL